MPHLLLHPHSRSPRRLAVTAAVAVLAVGAVALAGCTSAAPSTPGTTAAAAVEITGAGSTFDAPFFTAAFAAYQQAHLGVAVSYAAVGSSAGITRYVARQADFGATDVPASPADLAGASGATLQVPVDLGAVAVAYNVFNNGSGWWSARPTARSPRRAPLNWTSGIRRSDAVPAGSTAPRSSRPCKRP
jgi:ABC-type phosphate transport system substrate-binding protein